MACKTDAFLASEPVPGETYTQGKSAGEWTVSETGSYGADG